MPIAIELDGMADPPSDLDAGKVVDERRATVVLTAFLAVVFFWWRRRRR